MKFDSIKNKKSSELTEEVLKEVLFSLEEKMIQEAKKQKNQWEDIEKLKEIIKNALTPKMSEFSIAEFRNGKAKRDLHIVYKTPTDRLNNYRNVFNYLASLTDDNGKPIVSSVADYYGNSSIPYTQLNFTYSFVKKGEEIEVVKPIMLVHKFVYKNAWGLAQENILAYALDPAQDLKQMVKLKKRLGEPINKTGIEVEELLSTPEWSPMYEMAKKAKAIIEEKFGVGNIASAEAVGGAGGKEDIKLKLNKPWYDSLSNNSWNEIHISSKLGLTGKNPFIANIDLGDGVTTTGTFPIKQPKKSLKEEIGAASEGTEKQIGINLIPNPDNKPWWQTVRGRLCDSYLLEIEKQKNKISTSPTEEEISNEDLESLEQEILKYKSDMTMKTPLFLLNFREKYSSSYREIIKKFNDEIRGVFVRELRTLNIEDLATIVRYAFFGKRQQNSPPLFKITMTSANVTLEQVGEPKVGAVEKDPIIVNKSQITIDIPGLNPMIISGVKFRNNVLSSKKSDLNIKTRA